MKDQNAKRGKIKQNWINPNMAFRGIHFFAFVRENRLREKRREEKKRRREEEEEEKKKKKKSRHGYVRNFGMNLCMGFYMELVRILYGYLFGGLEYLFLCRILVWNGILVWLWSSMEEKI